jgi:hypothetical protein
MTVRMAAPTWRTRIKRQSSETGNGRRERNPPPTPKPVEGLGGPLPAPRSLLPAPGLGRRAWHPLPAPGLGRRAWHDLV